MSLLIRIIEESLQTLEPFSDGTLFGSGNRILRMLEGSLMRSAETTRADAV